MDADTQLAVTQSGVGNDADDEGGSDPQSHRLSRVVSARATTLDIRRDPQPPGNVNYLRIAQEAMRGRYLLAVVLGLITGTLFGALGWKMSRPVYQSEGLIRIAYSMPVVFEQTDQNQAMGNMFNTFLMSQRLLITSRRLAELAAQDPVWKANGVQPPADPTGYFADQLKVDVRPLSEYISITVTDPNPHMAAAGVTSIINAYQDVYGRQEEQMERRRIGALEDRRKTLQDQIAELNASITSASKEFGATQLDGLVEAATQRLNRMEMQLADVRVALASATAAAGASTVPSSGAQAASSQTSSPSSGDSPAASGAVGAAVQPAVAAAGTATLTPAQIATRDPVMRSYLDQEALLEGDLKRLTARGLGEAHREVIDKTLAIEEVKGRIERYAQIVRDLPAPAPAPFVPAASGGAQAAAGGSLLSPTASVAQLRTSAAGLERLCAEAKAEAVALGNKRLQLQRYGMDLASAREEMGRLMRRIETLRVEGSLGGRLNVVSSGGVPLTPQRDTRVKLAGAGAVAGAGLPVGLILLASLVWRRYRYSDETEADIAQDAPLLGILPELRRADLEGDRAAAAAHSVHQVRVSLQSQAAGTRPDGSRTYLVTSSTAGEGKTTLSTSLALSFAASRFRTLVIDADMVGRHLTDAMNAQGLEGLSEALQAGTIRGRVRKTAAGLYVLTVGSTTGPDATAVSAAGLRALLEECRQHFQVIIIDSGPVLGSLEAASLVQEVDGVILAISRGQQRDLVQKAMHRVRSLGGLVVGFVFNRAKPQDFHRSAYGTAVVSRARADAVVGAEANWDAESLSRFGPVVRAVATGFPAAN